MGKQEVDEAIQQEFPEVEKMTLEQRKQEYEIHRRAIDQKLDLISTRDNELIELIEAVIAGVIWLKEQHEKEGSISVSYTKKKNVRGDNQANINISATYKQNINEIDTESKTRNFLSKKFLTDRAKSDKD